jgi:hypothetical protein
LRKFDNATPADKVKATVGCLAEFIVTVIGSSVDDYGGKKSFASSYAKAVAEVVDTSLRSNELLYFPIPPVAYVQNDSVEGEL